MSQDLESSITALVDSLLESYEGDKYIDKVSTFEYPDEEVIIHLIDSLKRLVLQGFYNNKSYKVLTMKSPISILMEDVIYNLTRQISIVCKYNEDCGCGETSGREATDKALSEKALSITMEFLEKLPKIREYLETDVEAFYEGDPAAFNKDEIIYCYPGLNAILTYRFAHELHLLGVRMIPRIMTEHAHSLTGIDIHPGATIGKYFFIDHGTGIVVGETTHIGDHVKVYQGVTLGALSTRGGQNLRGKRRHPTIEDNVTIYSGASILGGETVIGEGAVIGGNTFITSSIPAGAKVSVKNQELAVNFSSGKNEGSRDLPVHFETRQLDDEDTWFYVI
ncbi:MAG: serine acetyltransferase [Lachnospiraceae bacterium]|nr:serine acetyltransferase [Lachnospiraceae bacterium]